MVIEGFYTALITPFHAEGEVDQRGLGELLDHQCKAGVDGVVLLGSTGEGQAIEPHERELIIEMGVERLSGKAAVWVATGHASTRETIRLSHRAEELGADGILVVVPPYTKPTQKGIYEHFQLLTKEVDLPILIYNHPGRTGTCIAPLTAHQLAALPNIVGLKEACEDLTHATDLFLHARQSNPSFSLLCGNDTLCMPFFALGGRGWISILGNLLPGPLSTLTAHLLAEETHKARELFHRYFPLMKAMGLESNPIPIKAAMKYCGLPGGAPRPPLTPLSGPHRDALEQLLLDAGVAPARYG